MLRFLLAVLAVALVAGCDPGSSRSLPSPTEPQELRFLAPPLASLVAMLLVLGATGAVPVFELGRYWTLISANYLHGGLLHIIFNMLNLYWFGQLVREYLGEKKLLSLYILGGIAGGILYLLSYNFIPYFAERAAASMMIGASNGTMKPPTVVDMRLALTESSTSS